MDVSNVEKSSLKPVMFKDKKEFTLERNPMKVSNVEKPLLIAITVKVT
jgi:hypothetical protein